MNDETESNGKKRLLKQKLTANGGTNIMHQRPAITLQRENALRDKYSSTRIDNMDSKSRLKTSKRIRINVSGTRFLTKRCFLNQVPNSLLCHLDENSVYYDAEDDEYFFARDPLLFSSILDLYHTGELHFTQIICAEKLKKELIFWQIDESYLSICCAADYIRRKDEEAHLKQMDRKFRLDGEIDVTLAQKKGIRFKIWSILNRPTSGILSRIWAYMYVLMVMVKLCLQTAFSVANFRLPYWPEDTTNFTEIDYFAHLRSEPKLYMYMTTGPPWILGDVETAIEVFFGMDIIARFVFSPQKLAFFKSFINIADLLAVVSFWTANSLSIYYVTEQNIVQMLPILLFLFAGCLLRVSHIFKLAGKYSAIRVLYLAFIASWREMSLLFALMFIGMACFGFLMYIAEFRESTFPDIPTSYYWAIITMTTTGYGDYTPKSVAGSCLAIVCALVGILLMAVPIPIIASNFMEYYNFAHLKRKMIEIEQKQIDDDEIIKPTIKPTEHRMPDRTPDTENTFVEQTATHDHPYNEIVTWRNSENSLNSQLTEEENDMEITPLDAYNFRPVNCDLVDFV